MDSASFGWHDIVGTAGVVLIVSAFLLIQLKKLTSDHLSYSILNGTGAALVLVSLSVDFNLAAAIIEVFWLAISVLGIGLWVRRRQLGREG